MIASVVHCQAILYHIRAEAELALTTMKAKVTKKSFFCKLPLIHSS